MFNFKNEATLNEFWYFFIINLFVSFSVGFLVSKMFPNNRDLLLSIYRVIDVYIIFSVGYRRVKNAGYSGWLFLIPFVNLIFAGLPEKK
jgi:uncharacterized membrane protein YhaH (DUF805 family)